MPNDTTDCRPLQGKIGATCRQRRAARLIADGLCTVCKSPHDRGTRRCRDCTERAVASNRKIKQEARKAGVCVNCRLPWAGNTKNCPACMASYRAKWKARADGITCTRCFAIKDGSHRSCSSCRLKMRAESNSRRGDFASKGQCVQCGRDKNGPGLYCDRCIIRAASRRYLGSSRRWKELLDLFSKQNGKCAYTREALVLGGNASIDHKLPRSRGGKNLIENLQWTTWIVNRVKTDMTHQEFIELCGKVSAGGGHVCE